MTVRLQSVPVPFAPMRMSPELAAQLAAEGFRLPPFWPYPARVVTSTRQADGWTLRQPGSLQPDHPHFMTGHMVSVYLAPDGTAFVECAKGAKPVVLVLSKRTAPLALRLADRQRKPSWVMDDKVKGDAPAHLKRFLFRKQGAEPEPDPPAPAAALVVPVPDALPDPRVVDVDRRITAQRDRGERVSPGLLAFRTRLLRGHVPPAREPQATCASRPVAADATAAPVTTVLESALQQWNVARLALATAEEEQQARSIPARRAILTRAVVRLQGAWAAAHPELNGNADAALTAYLAERVGQGITPPAPRRSLPRLCRAVTPKAPADPRLVQYATRAGVLASGLVQIVKTPAQLDAEGGWWSKPSWRARSPDESAAHRDGMAAGIPFWLRPARTPREVALAGIREADAERRQACRYVGARTFTVPTDMTDTQLSAALRSFARRLAGSGAIEIDVTTVPEAQVA